VPLKCIVSGGSLEFSERLEAGVGGVPHTNNQTEGSGVGG
jgi:hypothetical protein